jgi:predicted permease
MVLRPVPGARDASSLVDVSRTRPEGGGTLSASYPYYEYLASGAQSLDGLAAWGMMLLTVSTGGQGVSALGNAVSGNYFGVLGVQPALGRFFAGTDDRALAREPVVVVSHAFWQGTLAGDSSVIGRTLRVNGRPMTIVGVAPPRFSGVYPALKTDVWAPLDFRTQLRGDPSTLDRSDASWMQLVGRLAPGMPVARAREELTSLTAQYVQRVGDGEARSTNAYAAASVEAVAGVPTEVAGAVSGFFAVLLVIAALVLMIASMNVASMLLARAVVRRREIAMRMALGASRARLLRQMLVESLILFAIGGGAGTLLAVWGTRLVQRIELPIDMPIELHVTPDARVLAVTLAIALVTGLVFGLAPALQGSRLDVQGTLRSDSAGAGRRRSRLRDGLIVGQMAMSLLLLSAAGLFVRALGKGRAIDPGFRVDGVVTAAIDLESAGYDDARARAFFRTLRERLAAAPGVQRVSMSRLLPLSMSNSELSLGIPGHLGPDGEPTVNVTNDVVETDYFATLGIALVRGRAFATTDGEQGARVAVVNERFAQRYYPTTDALGQTVRLDSADVTIVGVVRDSRFVSLDQPPQPFIYLPLQQHWRSVGNVLVHTQGPMEGAGGALLREVAALDGTLPAPRLTTLRQVTAVMLLPQRVAAAVTGALGSTGLLLAAVGLFGILSFSTAQRTREIGVRLALGASRRGIVRMVLGDGLRLVGAGMVAGLALALVATRALRPFLLGVDPLDPVTFAAIGVLLLTVAMVATFIPARRASSVDPMRAMRDE